MYGMIVKQGLMAMGISDPVTLGMVDKILAGGFENPQMQPAPSDQFRIPEGAETLMLTATRPDGKYTVLLVCEKTS